MNSLGKRIFIHPKRGKYVVEARVQLGKHVVDSSIFLGCRGLSRSSFWLRHVAIHKLVSLGILRRLPSDSDTNIVGRSDLVPSELVSDLGQSSHRNVSQRIAECHYGLMLCPSSLGQE